MKSKLEKLTTEEKALALNLQPSIYGVFAEIGAGQEVANHFFKVGAASGTIAKTISAYDVIVSDSIYGGTKKYVSRSRVQSMLNVEYEQLVVNLAAKSSMMHFFVFANSIETTNFNNTNKGQGWLGVKFQLMPNSRPATCLVHIVFHTDDVNEQRRIVGDLGVNLIHSAYEYSENPELFVKGLSQNINSNNVEINFIEMDGEQFDKNTSLELSLHLVKSGLTKMIMLGADGKILSPTNALYKKDVLLNRGRFRPPTKVTEEMFFKAQQKLENDGLAMRHNILPIAEITFRCFQEQTELTLKDFIKRSQMITQLGHPLIVTNFTYHYELIDFLQTMFKMNSLNIILGLDNLRKVMNHNKSGDIEQKMLHLLSAMTSGNTRILAFPELNNDKKLSGLEELKVNEEIKSFYEFLKKSKRLQEIENVDEEILSIRSDQVLTALAKNEPWEFMVPESVIPILSNGHRSLIEGEGTSHLEINLNQQKTI